MICENISALLGISCMPVTHDGGIARIDAPFAFDDGDAVPIFVQALNGRVKFFDDGGMLMHFLGRGMSFEDGRKTRFIKTAAEANGVSFTDDGDVEVWANMDEAPGAFSSYVAALLHITAWEREQRGMVSDATLLVDEVLMCLRAWKPNAELVRRTGIWARLL